MGVIHNPTEPPPLFLWSSFMYRCGVCKNVSEPRQPRLLHSVYRTRPLSSHQEIAFEVNVCPLCFDSLQAMKNMDNREAFNILRKCNGTPTLLTSPLHHKRLPQPVVQVVSGDDIEEDAPIVVQPKLKPGVNNKSPRRASQSRYNDLGIDG